MVTKESITHQIKEILINQHGNIRVTEHPQLMKDAATLGLNERELSVLINNINSSIDWKIYDEIDEKLSEVLTNSGGIMREKDALAIAHEVKDHLRTEHTISYLIDKIKTFGLEPRDRFPLDWSSFRNAWMTEHAWKKTQDTAVIWLEEHATSLEKMGEISYRKIEETKYAIRNANALPPLVTLVTKNAARNEEYLQIIQDEPDLEKRYLKVLYRLNPALPFRFRNKEYSNIRSLLDDACSSSDAFWSLAKVFEDHHLQIWLKESSGDEIQKFIAYRNGFHDFLWFVYKIDNKYPFYLGDLRYDTPLALAAEARASREHWIDIADRIDNGTIEIWLKETGYDFEKKHKGITTYIQQAGHFDDMDRKRTLVQGLINFIIKDAPSPKVEVNVPYISLLELEAGKPFQQSIMMSLSTEGFVKVNIRMENAVSGMSIDGTNAVFHSQDYNRNHALMFTVDPLLLIKNKQYECSIIISSLFETITIPVTIMTVFPKKAFVFQLVKYALIMSAFFGIVRFLLTLIVPGSFAQNGFLSFDINIGDIPGIMFFAILILLLLIIGLLSSVAIIKKSEKI